MQRVLLWQLSLRHFKGTSLTIVFNGIQDLFPVHCSICFSITFNARLRYFMAVSCSLSTSVKSSPGLLLKKMFLYVDYKNILLIPLDLLHLFALRLRHKIFSFSFIQWNEIGNNENQENWYLHTWKLEILLTFNWYAMPVTTLLQLYSWVLITFIQIVDCHGVTLKMLSDHAD